MLREFKAFLIKQNVLALAIAVVIGAAVNDVVQGLVNDFIMPIVGALMPGTAWQNLTWSIGRVEFLYGHFLSVLLKFVIVAFVAWQIARALIKPSDEPKPATRPCPFCKQSIDATATRCSFCTSQLTATG
jgi:large conductance mechanosensitive channel